jgi:hypothetical protein
MSGTDAYAISRIPIIFYLFSGVLYITIFSVHVSLAKNINKTNKKIKKCVFVHFFPPNLLIYLKLNGLHVM